MRLLSIYPTSGTARSSTSSSILNGPLQRVRILTGAQRDLRTLFAERETFEQIPDELAESIILCVQLLDQVDDLATDACGRITNSPRLRLRRILTRKLVVEQNPEKLLCLSCELFTTLVFRRNGFGDSDDAFRDRAGVREIELEIDVSHVAVRHLR